MAGTNLEQIPSEIDAPFVIPNLRTVAEELAACQQLFQSRESRQAIAPIYERECRPEQRDELHDMLARSRQRNKIEKKVKVMRSPSLPATLNTKTTGKLSPRSANHYRK